MLLPFLRRLSVVALFSCASISQAQVFDWTGVAAGQCSTDQVTTITAWLADASTLITTALQATNQRYTGNEDILAFFTSYFGIQWDYSTPGAFENTESEIVFATVKSTLLAMSNFMAGKGLTEAAAGSEEAMTKTPYGYCGDGNYQEYSWYAEALLIDGHSIPNFETGGFYSVAQLFAVFNGQYTPYWAKTEQGYVFAGPGSPCSEEIDSAGNKQVTLAFVSRPYAPSLLPITTIDEAKLYGPAMAICDALLTTDGLTANYVDSLTDLANAYPTTDAPIELDSQIPKGAALFHELTHLTTDYVKDQWYPLDDCIKYAVIESGGSTVSAQNNANSYMFFALAVWYYYNPQNGYTATFYRGTSNDPVRMPSSY